MKFSDMKYDYLKSMSESSSIPICNIPIVLEFHFTEFNKIGNVRRTEY